MKYSAILLLLIFAISNSFAKIITKPYLQAGTFKSMVIMAECDKQEPVTVEFTDPTGKTEKASTFFIVETDTVPKTFVHRIKLKNLSENTSYKYKVYQDNNKSYTGDFKTLSRDNNDTVSFAILGDTRSNPNNVPAIFAKKILEKRPDFSIYLGDLCYKPGYQYYKNEFLIPEQLDLASKVPFYNAVGNHEDWKQNTKAFTQSPSDGTDNLPYYSFDAGDVHVLVMSTETSLSEKSDQYKFAEADLKTTKKKWKVVAFHIPAYCAGAHGENKVMKRLTTNLFEKYGVDVIFAGHCHFYQHNLVNGLHHFIMAGGGAPLYTPKEAPYVLKSVKTHHYGLVEVTGDKFIVRAFDKKDALVDEVIIQKKKK
jgi:predicted phosphodiesterase